jgi:microcystin-dependent protein
VQGNLFSDFSNETTATVVAPTNTPPAASTGLTPNASSPAKDATLPIPLSWTYNSTDGTAQTKFEIRHRVSGESTWTTIAAVTSSATTWTLPANTYTNGQSVEWQVVTWGTSATSSPWSASAIFKTAAVKVPGTVVTTTPDGESVPLQLNLSSSNIESPVAPQPPSWVYLVGEIKMWPLAVAPEGFLVCNGQAVSRDTYATLFSVLGTVFGAGDGSTTFNVPDYTDRSPIGKTPGAKGGAASVMLTAAMIPSHTHDMGSHTHSMQNHVHDITHNHLISSRESGPGPQNNHVMNAGGVGTLHEDNSSLHLNDTPNSGGPSTPNTGGPSTANTGTGNGLGGTAVPTQSPYLGTTFIIKY